jgi:hypothetical protein
MKTPWTLYFIYHSILTFGTPAESIQLSHIQHVESAASTAQSAPPALNLIVILSLVIQHLPSHHKEA